MTEEQVREINAMNHIENELIDEACGRVLSWLEQKGWLQNTDVFFTTDHGEFQGDFGLLFKGPYHVDALMRLPLIWRPAVPTEPAVVNAPVGHLDLAATFCRIAGVETPGYVEGQPLPLSNKEADTQERNHVLTEWDSEHGPIDMHLKSIYRRDGWLCTTYGKSSLYEGVEGELYDMNADPGQTVNLWEKEPAIRRELIDQLTESLPPPRTPRLDRQAPV
jgi:arylsulfatase A-like enzyme